MIPGVLDTVYCYLFPETWKIMKVVEESIPLWMYRLTGGSREVKQALSNVFEDYPLNTTDKYKEWVTGGTVDLDNHLGVMERITTKYSEIIHPLNDFEWVYPGAGSSPLIFHLLAYLKEKGYDTIATIAGEYAGYGAYANHLGMKVIIHNSFLDAVEEGNENTVWFVSNPSALNGNFVHPTFITSLCNKGVKVVLDLSYAGSTHPYTYDVSNENILAVILSQSKPYGVFRFRMGGFLYSREEIPSLFGNKWFKDPLRMLQSLKLVEDLGFHFLYRKYKYVQEESIAKINNEYELPISPSDALLIGYIEPSDIRSIDVKHRSMIEPYLRGRKHYRFCLTPHFEWRVDD